MKLFLKILKILISSVLFIYICTLIFFLFYFNDSKRFSIAEHLQGSLFSQTMFNILKYQNPNSSNIYFEQSIAFNKYGYHDKGFELLNKAVDLEPKMHLGYRGYMKLRFLRDFDGALSDFNRLDSLTPNFNDAPWGENIDFLRGECYYGTKNYQKAIECFQRNINNEKVGWADIQSFVYLGMCEYELKNYEKAIEVLKKGLEQSDKTTEAYLYLSKVYKAMGDLPKSRENLNKSKQNLGYKRDNEYNEYLNEIYLSDITELEKEIRK